MGPHLTATSPDSPTFGAPRAAPQSVPSGALINRARLRYHLNWVMHPPVPMWLIDEVEYALELAVAGCEHHRVEIDSRGYTVGEAVRLYELEPLVATARQRAL